MLTEQPVEADPQVGRRAERLITTGESIREGGHDADHEAVTDVEHVPIGVADRGIRVAEVPLVEGGDMLELLDMRIDQLGDGVVRQDRHRVGKERTELGDVPIELGRGQLRRIRVALGSRTRIVDEVADVVAPLLAERGTGLGAVYVLDRGDDLGGVFLEHSGGGIEVRPVGDGAANHLHRQEGMLGQQAVEAHAQRGGGRILFVHAPCGGWAGCDARDEHQADGDGAPHPRDDR